MVSEETHPLNLLSGKKSLVTGASGALGSDIADALRNAGSRVAGTFRSANSAKLKAHSDVQVHCDLTDEVSVSDCFADLRSRMGQLDIVVHCAGGFASEGAIEDTSINGWNTMISLNLTSSFLVMREGLRAFGESDYGRIILITALSAFSAGPGAVAYRTSKAGMRTLVEIADAEKRSRGITVNALAPGIIDTPQNRADMPQADSSAWVDPNSLARSVLYLCSPEGGAISGNVIRFP